MERIAVIGSGIAGLGAARALSRSPQARHVTLFEAAEHAGGHAHTVDITLNGIRHGVDTGFLVYNEHTYPHLTALFAELDVQTTASEMSFSVQVRPQGLEWCGSDVAGVFAQRRNLVRPAFWGMLADIVRFNHLATRLAERGDDAQLDELRTLEHSFDFTAWLERTRCTGEAAAQVEVLLGDRVSDGRLTLDKLAIRAVKGL